MNMLVQGKPLVFHLFQDNNVPLLSIDFTWKLRTEYEKIKYFVIRFQTHRERIFILMQWDLIDVI